MVKLDDTLKAVKRLMEIATTPMKPKFLQPLQKQAEKTPIMPWTPSVTPKSMMDWQAPLEKQASTIPQAVQSALPITQLPGVAGATVRQMGRYAGMQPSPLDVALLPAYAKMMKGSRMEDIKLLKEKILKQQKSYQKTLGFSPEDARQYANMDEIQKYVDKGYNVKDAEALVKKATGYDFKAPSKTPTKMVDVPTGTTQGQVGRPITNKIWQTPKLPQDVTLVLSDDKLTGAEKIQKLINTGISPDLAKAWVAKENLRSRISELGSSSDFTTWARANVDKPATLNEWKAQVLKEVRSRGVNSSKAQEMVKEATDYWHGTGKPSSQAGFIDFNAPIGKKKTMTSIQRADSYAGEAGSDYLNLTAKQQEVYDMARKRGVGIQNSLDWAKDKTPIGPQTTSGQIGKPIRNDPYEPIGAKVLKVTKSNGQDMLDEGFTHVVEVEKRNATGYEWFKTKDKAKAYADKIIKKIEAPPKTPIGDMGNYPTGGIMGDVGMPPGLSAKGRPEHQAAIERAINAGDFSKAKDLVAKMDPKDIYKNSMAELIALVQKLAKK